MKRIISICITLFYILSVFAIPSYASTNEASCEIDYLTNKVTINVTLEDAPKGTHVAFYDLNPFYDATYVLMLTSQSFKNAVSYFAQLSTDENNKITYTYSLSSKTEGGDHTLVLVRSDNGELIEFDNGYTFYDNNLKNTIVGYFNDASSKHEVKTLLDSYEFLISADSAPVEDIDKISACIYKDKEIKAFKDIVDVSKAYELGKKIVKLNDCDTFLDFVITLEEEGLLQEFETLPTYNDFNQMPSEDTEDIEESILSLDADHITDYTKAFTQNVVLKLVKNAPNYTYIDPIITNNKDYLTGIDFASYTKLKSKGGISKVIGKLKGMTFESAEDFERKVNEYVRAALNGLSQGGGSLNDSPSSTDAIAGAMTPPSVPTTTQTYTDMKNALWASDAVGTLTKRGIINGKTPTTFAPNDNITREEFVKLVVEAFGIYENGEETFTDVSENDWYYNYVKRAYASGIVNGINSSSFGVGQNITREDMAVILLRALEKSQVVSNHDTQFNDSSNISEYAKESVNKLVGLGIIQGFSDNTFGPKQNATRAQAAVMIYRIMMYRGI